MATEREAFKRAGFPGQKLHVVGRSVMRAALTEPVTSQILVTDCGYFLRLPVTAAFGPRAPDRRS